jgi:hypothetical protein
LSKTPKNREAVSSPPGEKGHWSPKWHRNTSNAGEKPEQTGQQKLANPGGRKIITKIAKKSSFMP